MHTGGGGRDKGGENGPVDGHSTSQPGVSAAAAAAAVTTLQSRRGSELSIGHVERRR